MRRLVLFYQGIIVLAPYQCSYILFVQIKQIAIATTKLMKDAMEEP